MTKTTRMGFLGGLGILGIFLKSPFFKVGGKLSKLSFDVLAINYEKL